MFQKRIVFALFFVTLFFLSQQTSFACSCGSRPTVLDEHKSSEVIIIAKAVSVEKADKEKGEYFQEDIKSTKWVVEKVYKGNVKAGDEISIGQGDGSNCYMIFKEKVVGNQFVFYIDARSIDSGENGRPVYYVSFCGKSGSLEYAANDLLFLDNLDKLRGKTRISGEINCFDKSCPSPANIEITFTLENKTFSTKTDKKGFYQIYDLPAGTYLIEAKLPRGWKAGNEEYDLMMNSSYVRYDYKNLKKPQINQFYFHLGNKDHIEFDFFSVPDNSIRGKVFSPVGTPMSDVCVSAIASEAADEKYSIPNCTNEKGEFVIEEIYPGNYFLVVNKGGKMSSREPFGEVFFPGVTDKKSAGLISIEPGKFLGDINIQIPKTVELIEITGRFLYSDGTPVADEKVTFNPSEKTENIDGETRVKTDAQGRFLIKILKNLRGILTAEMLVSVSDSKYENCPEVLKVMEELGERFTAVKTNQIEISGNENMSDVKLVLPFPNCEKKKD